MELCAIEGIIGFHPVDEYSSFPALCGGWARLLDEARRSEDLVGCDVGSGSGTLPIELAFKYPEVDILSDFKGVPSILQETQ